jgi:hypothetical protein
MTLTAREQADRANQALAAHNADAIRELLPAKLGVVTVTVTGTDVTFSGGPHGDHSLALVVTNEARALAHWRGYAQVAGINWAAPQRAHEDRWCCECDATIKRGQAMLGADFGDYCSAECAEQGHESYMEGQE